LIWKAGIAKQKRQDREKRTKYKEKKRFMDKTNLRLEMKNK